MGTDLQKLRNAAEVYCLLALRNGDQDTADAWERIGIAIDDCVKRINGDLVIIEARTGLFGLRVS